MQWAGNQGTVHNYRPSREEDNWLTCLFSFTFPCLPSSQGLTIPSFTILIHFTWGWVAQSPSSESNFSSSVMQRSTPLTQVPSTGSTPVLLESFPGATLHQELSVVLLSLKMNSLPFHNRLGLSLQHIRENQRHHPSILWNKGIFIFFFIYKEDNSYYSEHQAASIIAGGGKLVLTQEVSQETGEEKQSYANKSCQREEQLIGACGGEWKGGRRKWLISFGIWTTRW